MSVNSDLKASQQNMKKTSCLKIFSFITGAGDGDIGG